MERLEGIHGDWQYMPPEKVAAIDVNDVDDEIARAIGGEGAAELEASVSLGLTEMLPPINEN